MSYKYKEKIKEDLKHLLEGVSIDYYSSEEFIHKQKVKELDHVYSQAAKADEYEAKAKAWDSLKNNLEKKVEFLTDKVSGFPYVDAPIESTIGYFEHVLEMMKNYESGESD